MSDFSRIKKMLNGSTTMPQSTNMSGPASNVHYHDGVACTADHGHNHKEEKAAHNDSCCDNDQCGNK